LTPRSPGARDLDHPGGGSAAGEPVTRLSVWQGQGVNRGLPEGEIFPVPVRITQLGAGFWGE
jgi:hypothetical protein